MLIDDDKFWAQATIRGLAEKFEVVYISDPSEAIVFFEDRYDYDGIILDIMMESPEGVGSETEGGQLTGVYVLQRIAKAVSVQKVPVLLLTNHHDIARIEALVFSIQDLDTNVSVLSKHAVSRKELPNVIQQQIVDRSLPAPDPAINKFSDDSEFNKD